MIFVAPNFKSKKTIMKTFIKCLLFSALTVFITGCGLAVSAHPNATGKSCHAVYVDHTGVCQAVAIGVDAVHPFYHAGETINISSSDATGVHLFAVVGGDVIHPPGYTAKSNEITNGKGFDSAMLPDYYKEIRLYSWYIPSTIGKPSTKSEGSIACQAKLFLRTNHDKL